MQAAPIYIQPSRVHARVEALFFARILPAFCSHHARVKYPVFVITMV